jgi:outer membrane protein assembly factor BamD
MTSNIRTVTFHRHTLLFLATVLFAALLGACAAADEVVRSSPTEQRFREAMAEFEDEDYEESRKLFEAIVLQDPASEYADDAQYYLAESYFLDGDYHLAAYAYNRVRSFPNSPFYKLAIFKTGDSYYNSAEPYDRDQKETRAAIDHFRSFVQAYQGDSLSTIAQSRIRELRNRLAEKDYRTAEIYRSLDDPTAAIVYYAKTMDEYFDTDFYALAVAGKLASLCELERAADARSFADSLVLAIPNEPGVAPARAFQSTGCR